MFSPSRGVIAPAADAVFPAGVLTCASATPVLSSHKIPNQACRDILSSVADDDLARPRQPPKRNLYVGPVAAHGRRGPVCAKRVREFEESLAPAGHNRVVSGAIALVPHVAI
jgi:hypothetical protein